MPSTRSKIKTALFWVALWVALCINPDVAFPSECQGSAELHRVISGGQDGVYTEALEACTEGMLYTEWLAYEPSVCEERAGAAYDLTGDPETYESTLLACERGEP